MHKHIMTCLTTIFFTLSGCSEPLEYDISEIDEFTEFEYTANAGDIQTDTIDTDQDGVIESNESLEPTLEVVSKPLCDEDVELRWTVGLAEQDGERVFLTENLEGDLVTSDWRWTVECDLSTGTLDFAASRPVCVGGSWCSYFIGQLREDEVFACGWIVLEPGVTVITNSGERILPAEQIDGHLLPFETRR